MQGLARMKERRYDLEEMIQGWLADHPAQTVIALFCCLVFIPFAAAVEEKAFRKTEGALVLSYGMYDMALMTYLNGDLKDWTSGRRLHLATNPENSPKAHGADRPLVTSPSTTSNIPPFQTP